ncbi:hypothetical protein P3T40_007739 [Paraburkholderia sp. EB58]|jgi:hypothetical protein
MVSHSMPGDIGSLALMCKKRYGVSISLYFGGLHNRQVWVYSIIDVPSNPLKRVRQRECVRILLNAPRNRAGRGVSIEASEFHLDGGDQ